MTASVFSTAENFLEEIPAAPQGDQDRRDSAGEEEVCWRSGGPEGGAGPPGGSREEEKSFHVPGRSRRRDGPAGRGLYQEEEGACLMLPAAAAGGEPERPGKKVAEEGCRRACGCPVGGRGGSGCCKRRPVRAACHAPACRGPGRWVAIRRPGYAGQRSSRWNVTGLLEEEGMALLYLCRPCPRYGDRPTGLSGRCRCCLKYSNGRAKTYFINIFK